LAMVMRMDTVVKKGAPDNLHTDLDAKPRLTKGKKAAKRQDQGPPPISKTVEKNESQG